MSGHLRKHAAWIWLGGALAVIALIQAVSLGQGAKGPDLSVRSGGAHGALGAYEWLSRIGYTVNRATSEDLGLGDSPPRNTTLVLLQTGVQVPPAEADAVASWVSSGGRLILASEGSTANSLANRYGATLVPTFDQSVRVVQPLLQAPPVAVLENSRRGDATV